MRLAIVGTYHPHAAGKAAVLRSSPEIDFVGAYEPEPDIRAQRSQAEGFQAVRWLESEEEALGDPTVRGVVVDGRVSDNVAAAQRALERGKHVLLEKPAGTNLCDLTGLQAIARERGLTLQLGYQFRYSPALAFAVEAAQQGLLGDIFYARARISTTTARTSPDAVRELARYPGGIMFELGCHMLDRMVAIFGRPRKVTPFLRRDYDFASPDFPDNTVAVLEYERAMAVVESAAMEVAPFPHRRFEIHGTRGSVLVEPWAPPSVLLCLDEARDGYLAGWQPVDVGDWVPYSGDFAEFVGCIRGEQQPWHGMEHDLVVQEVLLKASGRPTRGEPAPALG